MNAWLKLETAAMVTGAKLYSACRNIAQRPPEQSTTGMIGAVLDNLLIGAKLERDLLIVSAREELTALEARLTGMIGAELDDLLLGARLANQGHWAKAQQSLLEQGLTAPGTRLNHGMIRAR